MSKLIFERLLADAKAKGVAIRNEASPRYIQRLSEGDAEFMAKADCLLVVATRHIKIVKMTYAMDAFFAVFGLSEPDQLPAGLETSPLTPGTFSASVLAADVHPPSYISGFAIRDVIEDRFIDEGSDYRGHDLIDIETLFPKVLLLKVCDQQAYHADSYRVLGSMLARTYFDGPIRLKPRTIDLIIELCEQSSEHVPFENIVQGVLSISWNGLFLEVYRCMEQLFAYGRTQNLIKKWPTIKSLRDVAALLEEELAWRPKEDEALIALIAECDAEAVKEACSAFGSQQSYDELENPGNTVGRLVYSLRNNIVHYRPFHKTVSKDDDDWNSIVRSMLKFIDQTYRKIGATFFNEAADLGKTMVEPFPHGEVDQVESTDEALRNTGVPEVNSVR